MRSTILVLSILLICSLLAGCGGPAEEVALKVEPTNTSTPLGSLGNPVTSNSDWEPVIEEFDDVQMALVPVGCFMMGSDTGRENEQPAHEQCIEEPYYIDIYEVTNSQYGKDVANTTKDKPIIYVDWFEASAYCEGRGGRLPSEVEWEYAARGPDNIIHPWGNSKPNKTNVVFILSQNNRVPSVVGSKPLGISWIGAYDMSGNVWEFTFSTLKPYPYASVDGREETGEIDSESSRVIRGGTFNTAIAERLQSTYRRGVSPSHSDEYIGFRCVRPQ